MLLEKVKSDPHYSSCYTPKKNMNKNPLEGTKTLLLLASKIKELLQEHQLSFIDDPEKFKREYHEQTQKTKHTFDFNPFESPLTTFNTEEIDQPFLEKEGTVTFYACDSKRIPYRVTISDKKTKAKVETLPLL